MNIISKKLKKHLAIHCSAPSEHLGKTNNHPIKQSINLNQKISPQNNLNLRQFLCKRYINSVLRALLQERNGNHKKQ